MLDDEVELPCYGIRTNEKLGLTVNPELNLAQAHHNATTPGVRPVSLAQLSKIYVTAVLMHDIGAVQLMLAHI